jgi:hypothetical protein
LASFPSIGHLFGYSNRDVPGQKHGEFIRCWELLDYVCPLILAKIWPSAENSTSDYMVDDRGTRAVICKLINEKWVISPAFPPVTKIMEDEFEEDVRSAQTGQGNLAGIFQNFSLASVYSPLQKSKTRGESSSHSYDNVGYLEPSPEVGRKIHSLLLPVGLVLVYGGMTMAIVADEISKKWLRYILFVCGGIAACGAPILIVIGWGIPSLIGRSM